MSEAWWQSFFDADYLKVWSGSMPEERTVAEADLLWRALALHPGSRVLDAPCGYGRIARLLASRGAMVVGVDQSSVLLEEAERTRGDLDHTRLRYLRHDLRNALAEGFFDAAFNFFSSLGYGSERDDIAVLRTLSGSIRPGGIVLVETIHRDAFVALLSREGQLARRLPNGTLLFEDSRFDAVTGRMETTWYWQGPSGGGQKSASSRIYAITELIQLLEQAGLRFRQALHSSSGNPFQGKGPNMGGRVALLATRVS